MPERQGGSYLREKGSGKPRLVERTKDHPEGNRARPARAEKPIEAGAQAAAESPAPEKETPAKPGTGKE